MPRKAQVFNIHDLERYDEEPLTNVFLFREEQFWACILYFRPGQVLRRHSHEHEHEVFDVIAGHGTIWLDGEAVHTRPGDVIFVPAGVEHGFENTGNEPWIVRATIHERTYARQALQRALLKRLGKLER